MGILIPRSINRLVYGSIANASVGQLFAAGVVPGLLLALSFSVYIAIFHGKVGDEATDLVRMPLRQKLAVSKHLIPPFVIFGVVMRSIYGGLATPTESAAIGVMISLGFVALGGQLNWALLAACSYQAARTSGMVMIVLVVALLLNVTISMTGAAQAVTGWIAGFDLDRLTLLLVLLVFYVILGTFMDAMSMMVLTVPIMMPVILVAGIDPIWFGIFVVIMCEIALITPPVEMNLFVVHGVRTDGGSYGDVIRGAFPYVIVMMGFTIVLILWPGLVMWLPDMLARRS